MRMKTVSWKITRLMLVGCLFFLFDVGAFAQGTRTISGTVLDAGTNEPMIGVSVVEKGTSNGTVTDIDGKFVLSVRQSANVTFSYVGYVTRELAVSRVSGNIMMTEDDKTLSEVVVVGYGTQKRVNLSGAVTAVDGDKLAGKPASDVLSAMQGELPGVAVLRSSGEPGSETSGLWCPRSCRCCSCNDKEW